MPYKLEKVEWGYYVKKDQPGRPVRFSKKPLPKKKAEAQMKALYANEPKISRKKQNKKYWE